MVYIGYPYFVKLPFRVEGLRAWSLGIWPLGFVSSCVGFISGGLSKVLAGIVRVSTLNFDLCSICIYVDLGV